MRELYEAFTAIPNLTVDFIDAIEWSDPHAVSNAIGGFDIGLYPLLPNEFNEHKCGFKALEYMAMAVPVVSSPVAINADIVEDGETGYLVRTKEEWIRSLSRLIEMPEEQVRMGMAGRKKVETAFDILSTGNRVSNIIQIGEARLEK